jgi:hypothetical protein
VGLEPRADCAPGTAFGPALARLPFWAAGNDTKFAELSRVFGDPVDPARGGDGTSRWTASGGLLSVRGSPTDWVAYSRGTSPVSTYAGSEAYVRRVLGDLGLPPPEAFHSWPEGGGDGTEWNLYWDQPTPAGPMQGGSAHFGLGPSGSKGLRLDAYAAFEPLPPQPAINLTQAREVAAAQAECLGHVDRSAWGDPLENATSNSLGPGGDPERLQYVIRVSWGQDTPSPSMGVHGCNGPATFVTVDALTGAIASWRVDRPLGCD